MSTDLSTRDLWLDGLWRENPAMVKLLGLCPLLAISNSAINALSLGLASLFTVLVANTSVSALRTIIPTAVRIPIYVLIIAGTVTVVELLAQAYTPAIHQSLGIFLPLIVTNCLILGRAESFAQRQPLRAAVHDALAMGLGFLLVLFVLGSAREVIGSGTFLQGAEHLFGARAANWHMQLYGNDYTILIALLPPGAFIALGCLLALRAALSN
ncbi:MAG: electron transport complex subunit E [Gammaproteobacteria bacterium]|nr:electron transport complex subunit E [Gammaproteobacteria bacterium]